MVSSKHSPNARRKSIAVVGDQNKPAFIQRSKRRAYSIAPGELSPLAKARRSLVPRKSILKSSVAIPQNGSQSSLPSSQSTSLIDENATQSMDLTRDFTTNNIYDNTSRKSLGRRVSFARTAKVRIFEKAGDNTASTNATDSPQSSPESSPQASHHESHPDPPALANENDYPGARSRRRSSVRYSMAGSEDMDLTSIGPRITDDSFNFEDDNFDFNTDDDTHFMGEDDDNDNMDVTQALDANLIRRRTLSIGGPSNRPPLAELANIPRPDPPSLQLKQDAADLSADTSQDMDMSGITDLDDTQSAPMEFTVPITQGLRTPAHQDPAWLALRAVTHSGDTPFEQPQEDEGTGPLTFSSPNRGGNHSFDNDMDLDDALGRLMQARESLPNAQSIPQRGPQDIDDTFTSSEGSLVEGFYGEETVNISKIIGRASLGGFSARPSLAFDTTMEATSLYGNIHAVNGIPVESTPTVNHTLPPNETTEPPPRPPVFQRPTESVNAEATSSTSANLPLSSSVFTPKPPSTSPSKTKAGPRPSSPSKPKPTFTAAFAPPTSKTSPKKPRPSTTDTTRGSKRSRDTQEQDLQNPSTRRVALSSNDGSGPQSVPVDGSNSSNQASSSKPRISSTLRRPSGYFSRRQSMSSGVLGPQATSQIPDPSGANPSPKKIGKARASVGSASSDAWMRFDKSEIPQTLKGKEKQLEPPHGQDLEQPPVEPMYQPDREDEQSMELDADDPGQPLDREPSSLPQPNAKLASTEQWVNGIIPQDGPPDEDTPSISIAEFFQISGIKFMEELTAPRRSMSQPGRPERQAADIPLAEYAIATAIDLPQLSLYTRVANDLDAWMKKSKVDMQEMEEEAAKAMPELFSEYLAADEEGKDQLRHHLNLIRTNVRELAKAEWYNWKLQWIDGLNEIATQRLEDLRSDAQAIEGITGRAEEILPTLQKQYAEVMAELEKEQAEVEEILESDQDYLNELKASIAEQDVEVEALRAELAESNAQLAQLKERLSEIEDESRQSEAAIASAKRLLHVQESSTLDEVMRLKDELEAMEDLHKFHASRVSPDVFEYTYASRYNITIPCNNYRPIVSQISISKREDKAKPRSKDTQPLLSDHFMLTAKDQLLRNHQDWTLRKIVHCLADYWTSCTQIRSQLDLLAIKYPLTIEIPSPTTPASFIAKAQLMFPSAKAKAFVRFTFSPDTFASWPMSISHLPCDVKVAYGSVQQELIRETIVTRLSEASAEENHACLLDACIGAQEVYQ
ncbi:hypothetical protein ONZ45_g5726 [Pleurotus djamor]|nr:hypothetical protein ONZ45_g5726 [Pleurotus djamor]